VIFPDAPVASAGDLVDMLRRHYLPEGRPAGGIFAHEIESPDGRRRADALWCPWSIAGGAGLVGHEVKVSRSDVLAELADPMKAEPWARYCSRWWLVVAHPSLVDGLAVPEAWGIMAPPSGRRRRTMTVVREAPALKPHDTGPGWRRIASWYDYRVTTQLREAQYAAEVAKRTAERAEADLLERRLAEGGRADHRAALVGRILAALDRQPGWYRPDVDVDEIVAAIVDVERHRRLARTARSEVEMLVSEVRRVTAPMAYVADELERLARTNQPAAEVGG
jgi:hypothetical protein